MSPTKQHKILFELMTILKSFCHAPGCGTVNICPHQCSCRNRRTFKTNNETAICWELANNIFNYLRGDRKLVKQKTRLEAQALAYTNLSRYHMTRGWTNLFEIAHQTIQMVLNNHDYYFSFKLSIPGRFMEMKRVINRLKRDPKG